MPTISPNRDLPNPDFIDNLLRQAIALHQAGRLVEAEALYRQVLLVVPDHADALHLLGLVAHQVHRSDLALDLMDRALAANPAHAEAWNNRGTVLHTLMRLPEAVESYDRAIALKPEYVEAWTNRGNTLYLLERFDEALASYDRASACGQTNEGEALRQFRAAMRERARIASIGDPRQMRAELEALPLEMRSRPAICDLHNRIFVKQHSSGNDLVFVCGATPEVWNPERAKTRGVGGSEEAVIWLSRLLAARGWTVTVYCTCGEAHDCDGVAWKPHWMWNWRDRQDVTVLWRYPQLARYPINSAKIVLDLHDVVPESELTPDRLARIDRIFVKSLFHRSLFPGIPDKKFAITPNGIDAWLFEGPCERDPMLLINTSSADRSLETFLGCFAEIRKQVPHAKAKWAYGWGVWDAFYSADPQRLAWKQAMQSRMKQLRVEELGRVSHEEVARLYRSANVFAYPSEMAEIDCISLSKAMAAGAVPLTTDFAAMGEKAGHGGVFIHSEKTKDNWILPGQFRTDMTGVEQKQQFVREAVQLLLHPPSEEEREPMRAWARETFDWDRIAGRWERTLREALR